MSEKERNRLILMEQVRAGSLALVEAADALGVGYRQAKRIWARFGRQGASGLLHAGRDRVSNRQLDASVKERALQLYREQYPDFGPTLAAEKMAERDGVAVHRETLRRWLIAARLWPGRTAHRRHRRRRPRREHFGELVQLDGSHHAWFESRGAPACLMVMVDDATGRCEARLSQGETLAAAFGVLGHWIERHGVPEALYTDRKNIYVTQREPTDEEKRLGTGALTDFGRACWRLGSRQIVAHSPQAKGRVERQNGVFQDRLVKELRLRAIDAIEPANAILDDFTDDLNARFARAPHAAANRHRALPIEGSLADILCVERSRVVQNDWTFTLDARVFQILPQPQAPRARQRVRVRRRMDGSIQCLYEGRELRTEELIWPRR
jgi:transposase